MAARTIVSLVTWNESENAFQVSFHKSKRDANKHAEGLTYDMGWVVEKLEDITADDQPMTIKHLNSFIGQFISSDKCTESLTDAQNLVWGYLASGGDNAGSAAPETPAAIRPAEAGQGDETMATATDTRKRPAKRVPAAKAKKAAAAKKSAAKKGGAKRAPRADSQVNKVIGMMQRSNGATVAEIAKALDWKTKSVHGVISGVLRNKMKLKVKSERDEKRGNVYSLPS